MKKFLPLLAIAFLPSLGTTAHADDVAVMHIQTGGQLQSVVIELYEDSAPATVANFKKLAKSNFYSGTAFHRVFPHLMVQGGDPLSKNKSSASIGTGGPGYTLPAEINRKHIAGTIAAARLPDKINPSRRSNGSQFYITLVPMPNLDGQDTIFGRVIEGMGVLDKISQIRTDTNDNPVDPAVIEGVRIVSREAAAAGTTPAPGRLNRVFARFFHWF